MNFKNFSLVIIAGGKSSRLGRDKRFVEVGGVGLLEKILGKAAAEDFAEIFLCVEENLPALKILAERFGAKLLVDEIKSSGPLAGLAGGLAHTKTDWAAAISADMPFFEFDALFPLTEKFSAAQAVVPIVGGKFQPLAAFYCRELAEIFSAEVRGGQRKIFSAIKKIPHEFAELSGEEKFFNVNTPADLRLARGRAENLSRPTPIISIVAPSSGTGKTFFIERLVKIFSAQKISVGVIKSDAHGFNLDAEGKDSFRFQTAGAKSVAVVSPGGWFMIQNSPEDFFSVAQKMTGVDLILTESRTKNFFPTISLWRGRGEIIADEKVAAIFSSAPVASDEIYHFDLNDLAAAEKICKFLAGFTQCCKSRGRSPRTESHA
ncbi:MAG: molybdopterin-guanine dinucleotide biosynthesis protein B [Selenomonadaceae bacterium]|nr:molybdopterin-guanine dinucleotide biosynthesis protein B [Selenomonadaceae bacterium]